MNSGHQVKILSPKDSASIRETYFSAFVDRECEHYKRFIGTKQRFSDGEHYTGYVWDCLRQTSRITYERFCHEIVRHKEVYAFADDHSRERVLEPPLWPYRPYSIIVLAPELLLQLLPALPEDLYVFDSTVLWTLVLTHERDHKRRLCVGIGLND